MHLLLIAILAVVQGAAELLPVSSSAHVIIVEKLFGLDPTTPEMTFLLVMLHTGTMAAVLVYYWSRWGRLLSRSNAHRWDFVKMLVIATVATGIVGLALQYLIETIVLGGKRGAAVENVFGNLWIIAPSLAVVGALIMIAGFWQRSHANSPSEGGSLAGAPPGRLAWTSLLIGIVQGLALPFRGFSRSGSTISTGLLAGMDRRLAEELSFALAVILTIPVVGREALRLRHGVPAAGHAFSSFPVLTGIIGMVFSFAAGLAALRWLSAWLEKSRWGFFGVYCVVFSVLILVLMGTGAIT